MYYNEYFPKNSTNLRKLWTGVNQILNKSNFSSNIPVCIEIEGNVNTISNPEDIANAFNSHEIAAAENILKKRKHGGNKTYKAFIKILILILS